MTINTNLAGWQDDVLSATISGFGFALGGLLFVYFLHITKKGRL